MDNAEKLIELLGTSTDRLIKKGKLNTGDVYRPSQRDAFLAYGKFLSDTSLSVSERLSGFFEMPAGVGKTAFFGAILDESYASPIARRNGFRGVVIAPMNIITGQTLNSIKKFAPSLSDSVGIYNGYIKQPDSPILITTYNSFCTMVDQQFLTPDNVDLIISDEGH